MNISEPFIRRPVMTTLVMATVLLLGLMTYFYLPVSNLPDVAYPTIQVTAAFPGASPSTMANTVASPLEKEFMTIPGITDVTSTSVLGTTTIVLQFNINKSMDSAAQDVEAAISRAKSQLPPNLPSDPVYKKVNPSDSPIIYIALTSPTMTPWDLYTYAYTYIGQRITMLDGVAQVVTYGTPFAVRVQVDPGALASKQISLSDLSRALAAANPNLPTGQLDGTNISSMILTEGQLLKAEEYQPIIISYKNQAPVRIQDIGRAIDNLQNNKLTSKYIDSTRNQPTVVLAVQRQPGANTIAVADAIAAYLPTLSQQLPASVELEIVFDRSDSIKESIHEVKITLILALFLVVSVIFVYLGKIRDTIIPSLVLPMSLFATFIVMYLYNFSLDNLSLLALVLAVGFIVDDAIVVLENIVRRIEEGETPWKATLHGSQQIGFTILSMTLSLGAVFIPMLFLGGLIGKIFQEFSIVLLVVTLASGVISLTLTPMLCSLFLPSREAHKEGSVERWSRIWNDKMVNVYKPALTWAIDHGSLILLTGLACVVLCFWFFKTLPTDFIPDDDIGFIIAFSQAEQGTSSDKMQGYESKIIQTLQENPNIATIVSITSHTQYREGINFIRLKPYGSRDSVEKIIQQLYPKLGMIPGVNVFLKNIPLIDLSTGAVSKGAYQYTMQSTETNALYSSAEKLLQLMHQDPTFQGITSDLEIKTPQLDVKILRDQAYALGVKAEEIEQTLLLAFSGNRVSRIQTPIDQYDVILEVDPKFQKDAASLAALYVKSEINGNMVPLNAVATWKEVVGPASINHVAQFPAVTISFNTAPGIALGTALERLDKLTAEALGNNVTGSVKGAAQTFQETIESSGYLLIFSVLAIYVVLGILYESFIHPLTILSTLPPAALGGLLTLAIFDKPLSLYAYLGIILLIGIVKKNGIMVVDFALENIRHKQIDPKEAIIQASLARFRPIMMTTFAAIFGAIPIVMGTGSGAESRRPLGMVIIGGLLVSQLITLFLTPVVYLYLEKYEQKFSKGHNSRQGIQE